MDRRWSSRVRHDDEKCSLSSFDAAIGYCHRQVSFPGTAAGPGESQPTSGILGVFSGGFQGFLEHLAAANVGEGDHWDRVAPKVILD